MMLMHKFPFLKLFATLLLCGFVVKANAEVIAVIVPHNQTIHQIGSSELSLIFWRKKLYWADGKRIQTLNYASNNSIRIQFSLAILKSMPETQADYWNGLYFHGISPPYVVSSQEAMLRFVADSPGGIGYIDACKLDDRVKPIAWISAGRNLLSSAPELNCPE
ncbi:MAG: hypothetical protein U1C59_02735 [Methylotenera sp.]|nr:hypothetical protein [Methylotenera sp.]MDZ4210617.1 hypothetical protein [Methylotenera sp.]